MKLRLILAPGAGLVVLLATVQTPAQDKKDPPPDVSAPGPEHKVLEDLVGQYTAEVKAFFDPTKEPEKSTGVMKRKLLMGGRYLQEEFEGKLGDVTFTGMGIIAFDKGKKKYVTSWIDSMSTGFMTGEGGYDAAKKTFTYLSDDVDPQTGKKMKGRDVLHLDSVDRQTFEMFRRPAEEGGKEVKVLEIIYTRKK